MSSRLGCDVDVDSALVYAFGKSSLGTISEVLTLQLDPYYLAPLGADTVSIAALQARALIDGSEYDERDIAEVAARSRRDGEANPRAHAGDGAPADELLTRPYTVSPLREHDCPPVSDGAAAIVLAAGETAKRLCERPAWIKGIDHRVEHPVGKQELRPLKPLGQLLPNGLLDHAWPGKPYQGSRLSYVEISEHCVARSYASGGGIGKHRDIRQPFFIQPRERSRYLGHLHER